MLSRLVKNVATCMETNMHDYYIVHCMHLCNLCDVLSNYIIYFSYNSLAKTFSYTYFFIFVNKQVLLRLIFLV